MVDQIMETRARDGVWFGLDGRLGALFLPMLRYGIVGVLSNVAGYLVYLLITWLGGGPKATMTCLYFVGASVGFIGNRQWAFAHKGNVLASSVRYAVTHLLAFWIDFFMLAFFVDWLDFPHQWIQAAAVAIIAPFLFLMFRFFVFPEPIGTGKTI